VVIDIVKLGLQYCKAPPPDYSKIPDKDVVGITALLLTCSYFNQEFVRVGYYVNNEYDSPELRENPPKSAGEVTMRPE
jgi:histone chaperone ASF1